MVGFVAPGLVLTMYLAVPDFNIPGCGGRFRYLTWQGVKMEMRMRNAVGHRARRRHDAVFGNRNVNAGGHLINS